MWHVIIARFQQFHLLPHPISIYFSFHHFISTLLPHFFYSPFTLHPFSSFLTFHVLQSTPAITSHVNLHSWNIVILHISFSFFTFISLKVNNSLKIILKSILKIIQFWKGSMFDLNSRQKEDCFQILWNKVQ